MPRVRFTADFDWKPTPSSTIAYRAGMQMSVTRRCAAEAVATGAAELMSPRAKAKESADAEGQSEGAVVA